MYQAIKVFAIARPYQEYFLNHDGNPDATNYARIPFHNYVPPVAPGGLWQPAPHYCYNTIQNVASLNR
jgi:hypothetical protein